MIQAIIADFRRYNIYVAKIIHLDMDCFYAAVEIRDNPFP